MLSSKKRLGFSLNLKKSAALIALLFCAVQYGQVQAQVQATPKCRLNSNVSKPCKGRTGKAWCSWPSEKDGQYKKCRWVGAKCVDGESLPVFTRCETLRTQKKCTSKKRPWCVWK